MDLKYIYIRLSQLKRTGNQVLLKGGTLEDAITAAITAMNEPKTCSTTTLRRYLVDANKDRKEYQLGETSSPSLSHALTHTSQAFPLHNFWHFKFKSSLKMLCNTIKLQCMRLSH